LSSTSEKKEACALHVDVIDDTLVELFEDLVRYEEGFKRKDRRLMEYAARRLERQADRIDWLYEASIRMGAPRVISEEEKEMLKADIKGISRAMSEGEDPDLIDESVFAIDKKWKIRLWDKYCECLKKANLI